MLGRPKPRKHIRPDAGVWECPELGIDRDQGIDPLPWIFHLPSSTLVRENLLSKAFSG